MTPEQRRRFVVAAAEAITDDPATTQLLAMKGGRKERVGSAALSTLANVARSNPDSFDRRAFCVRTADDLLVLDADSPDAAGAALEVARRAEAAGLEPVVVSSGRPGHIHVWIRVLDGVLRASLSQLAAAEGVDVRTGNWVRPPLSVHPDGTFGELLSPTDPDEALRRLSRPAGFAAPQAPPVVPSAPPRPVPPRQERRRFGPALSAAMLRILRDGDGNPDRSVTLQRVVTAMVNRGWTIDAAWALLTKPSSKCAAKLHDKLRDKGEDVAFRYLEHCWLNAEEFCARNPAVGGGESSEVLDALDRLLERIDEVPWPGATGSSTWMVLHQMVQIARRAGTLTPTISERQLAEECSLNRATVHGAVQRLLRDGWVVQLKKGSGPKASLWQLPVEPERVPAGGNGRGDRGGLRLVGSHERSDPGDLTRRSDPLAHPPAPPAGGVRDSGTNLRGSHDAFRNAALGTLGYRILRYLRRHGPAEVGAIAAALGCHAGSVARLLRSRLGAVGLVERQGFGRWGLMRVDVEAALDWAAQRFGTAGAGERQRRLHQWEREVYRRSPSWGLDLDWWDQWETTRGSVAAMAA